MSQTARFEAPLHHLMMFDPHVLWLALAIFGVAVLYSAVGHAGASGYIAVMALFGVAAAALKPTALLLNILVSVIASVQFWRAGFFSWSRLWPFAVTSVPLAFIGGAVTLPAGYYRPLVGAVLVFSAVRLLLRPTPQAAEVRQPPLAAALASGGLMGLLSGLTGVGGGIFLSPLLLFMRWADARQASATAAVFILVNSVAGLGGHLSALSVVPGYAPMLAISAVLGGLLGSHYGSRRLPVPVIRRTLALVLFIAGLKLVFI